jgi:predicted glycosyltransferase
LEKIVYDNNIDIVISDNRYGCWSSFAKSIFITHQLNILVPEGMKWLSILLNYFNRKLISKYDACWVPDDGREKLTGELSESNFVDAKFIGILSRFNRCLPSVDLAYKVIVVLSGPEPQRTCLEEMLLTQLKQMTLKVLVVRGVPGKEKQQISDHIEVVDFLNSEQLNTAICQSEIVIARSGYSTIMDLMKLGKRAILIPTPGQTEQEYLASKLNRQSIVYVVSQSNINLKNDIENAYRFSGFQASVENENLLKDFIADLIK